VKKKAVRIGARFGMLIVIGRADSDARGNQRVCVRCDCGKEKTVRTANLYMQPYRDRNGKLRAPVRSCGCQSRRAYREILERRARGVKQKTRKRLHRAFSRGYGLSWISQNYRLPSEVVSALYQDWRATHPIAAAARQSRRRPYRSPEDEPSW
jgi:hypothetical protein